MLWRKNRFHSGVKMVVLFLFCNYTAPKRKGPNMPIINRLAESKKSFSFWRENGGAVFILQLHCPQTQGAQYADY